MRSRFLSATGMLYIGGESPPWTPATGESNSDAQV